MISVTVAQISEFSFVFAAVGLNTGLIDEVILSLITAIGLITIVDNSYMILRSERLYEWVRRRGWLRPLRAAQVDEEETAPMLHIETSNNLLAYRCRQAGVAIGGAAH